MRWPVLYRWDRGPLGRSRWSVGWWGGSEDDLLCIRPGIRDNAEAEIYLSPVCRHRAQALVAFCLKNALAFLDLNMRSRT